MADASQLALGVRAYLTRHRCLEGVGRVLVGFSGGADSTALLLLLRELGLPLVAHHIHHGLRGADADADAEWCREFCAARSVPFQLHHVDVPGKQGQRESIEAAARRCRLELWGRACTAGDAVALGHHADDAVEDLFLRLARGANASGLTGLRPRRLIHGIPFLRPLLALRRDELRDYLLGLGIDDWREDHTNAESVHRRNAIRHQLLPAFREVFDGDAGLHRALTALRADATYLEDEAAKAMLPSMSLDSWRQLPSALLPRVLRLWLARETGHDTPPHHTDTTRLAKTLSRPLDGPVELPLACGPVLVVDQDGLRIKHSPSPLVERFWNWQEEPILPLPEIQSELVTDPTGSLPGETFARDSLPPTLIIRSRQPGDRMVPFGSTSPKKLQDLFTDAHIPRERRDSVPVILADDTIVWVPGLRRAEHGRVSAGQPTVRLAILPVSRS